MLWPYFEDHLQNLPLYLPTLKGHLRQEKRNIISTKKIETKDKPKSEASPTKESKTQDCFFQSQQRNPEQHTQTSLEDIQLLRFAATSTFPFSTIMKII